MKIVQFNNGRYGIRRGWWWSRKYYTVDSNGYFDSWWSNKYTMFKHYCQVDTKQEAMYLYDKMKRNKRDSISETRTICR